MAKSTNKLLSAALLLLLVFGSSCSGAAVSINGSVAIDALTLVTNPCQEVRLAGFICVDCATLGFCTHVDGQWQTVGMTQCDAERGFYCSDEENIGCTWQPRCQVPVRGKFFCQLPGTYPDPYDCRSYHVCDERNEDSPKQCTNGAAFSLLTQTCSLPKESEQCQEKQYNCSYVGQTGVWPTNSSYYYVCQKDQQGDEEIYYPLMMLCPQGYIYNGHSCVRQAHTLTLIMGRSNTANCSDGQLYAAAAANEYYVCLGGQLYKESCPNDTYFDAVFQLCRMGKPSSDALQCGDVGSGTAPQVAKCGYVGMAGDLTDCTRYYHCAAKGDTMQHGSCPPGYRFDLVKLTCLAGTC